jgi:hypothetical protein
MGALRYTMTGTLPSTRALWDSSAGTSCPAAVMGITRATATDTLNKMPGLAQARIVGSTSEWRQPCGDRFSSRWRRQDVEVASDAGLTGHRPQSSRPQKARGELEGLDEFARRLAIGFDFLELSTVSTIPRP